MPRTRVQEVIYTVMMVFVMVYAMICYNVALDQGGVYMHTFADGLPEMLIMVPAGFLLDTFIAGPIAKKLAFRHFTPGKDKMIFVILAISVFSIWLMCPMMSLIASIFFKDGIANGLLNTWVETTIINFPMAFFWQLFAAGPLVRFVFGKLFSEKNVQGERVEA